jgi:hypothetical protein
VGGLINYFLGMGWGFVIIDLDRLPKYKLVVVALLAKNLVQSINLLCYQMR